MNSGRRFSLFTKYLFMTNRIQNTAKTTINAIDISDFQMNKIPTSKNSVINSKLFSVVTMFQIHLIRLEK